MRKIFILIFIYHLQFHTVRSQNLIINPSFEDTVTCLQWIGLSNGLLICTPWFMSMGTPDYFSNSVYLNFCGASTLYPNSFLGFQLPLTGFGMTGFELSNFNREMLATPITPLLPSHLYYVMFKVSPCNNCGLVTDDIGAYLSIDSLNPDSILSLNLLPQVLNPQGNYINDTASWTLISGYYLASGGEKYLYIGNFKNAVNTTFDTIVGASYQGSYYFLDDVSIVDCTAVGVNEQQQATFNLLQNPVVNSIGFTSPFKIKAAKVYNTLGVVVKECEFATQSNYKIDVADLPGGVYFLKVETNDKRRGVRKFVKQ